MIAERSRAPGSRSTSLWVLIGAVIQATGPSSVVAENLPQARHPGPLPRPLWLALVAVPALDRYLSAKNNCARCDHDASCYGRLAEHAVQEPLILAILLHVHS
jgi:hypothetical protein